MSEPRAESGCTAGPHTCAPDWCPEDCDCPPGECPQSAEKGAVLQVCPICLRNAPVTTSPGAFGMESVMFMEHYESGAWNARLCGSVGIWHVQRVTRPGKN